MNEHGEDWRSRLEEETAPGVLPDDLSRAREPGRGREANTPGEIPARGWKDILWRVLWGISEDRILSTSGGVAFFALLAVFPAIATIVSLYGLFADTSTIRGHLSLLAGIVPGGVLELIGEQISLIATEGNDTLGAAFMIGFLVALWSANAGVAALFDALNVVYGEKEKRSLVRFYATTFLITLGMIGFIILAVLSGWRRFGTCGRISSMSTTSNPYRGYRFPAEIINQAVWLYHCFSLSLREVELILAERGIVVSYETIREWSLRFGRTYAETLRRRRPKPGDKWFLDEVFVRIRGKLHYLWRAVDQHGNVLDVLVQSRRNTKAAKRFFRKLLKGLCHVPRVIVTDKLASYGAAKREILPGVEHRQSRYLNNRCEVSHQPTRRRERHMRRFKSVRQAQQFLATHSPLHNHFQLRRHRLSASEYRAARDRAFLSWRDATGAALVD